MKHVTGDGRHCEAEGAGPDPAPFGQECRCLGGVPAITEDFVRELAELTPREREVLSRLALCDTNRAIARSLHITERTAKAHLTRIMAKLGLGSRTESAIVALRYHDMLCHPLGPAGVYQGPLSAAA
ncbi:helix-turn-helix transcriptional regulator [Streptomyces sp. NPDC002138]|uniref:helix-turn-helix domain-containing protein n=1 Tax=Streptomyces sp. NPDC002138 TaxID=3154410 RepID=UPI0033242B10